MSLPKHPEKKHLPHLTGFRAIAAYLVLISHSADTTFLYGNDASIAHTYVACMAYLGMSIFFVLSGFIITYTYYDRFIRLPWLEATRDFAVARFARLYPLYIVILLCNRQYYKPLFRHASHGAQASYLTLTQSWWNMQHLLFAPAWSISTECFFYVCFALWMLPGKSRRASATFIQRCAIITLAGVFLILAALFFHRTDITAFLSPLSRSSQPDVWYWFKYISPYVRLGEFIAGVCAARMYMVTQHDERLPKQEKRAGMLCIGSVLVIFTLMIGNAGGFAQDGFLYFLSQNFGYAPFLAYILYACSRYPNILTRWCSTPIMQTGGNISYSVYLIQFWVYSNVWPEQVATSPSPLHLVLITSFLKALLYIPLVTVVAFCSYHIIEVPSRRFLRKWLD